MDIGKFNFDGEWLELQPENEKFGAFKVKVIPNPFYDAIIDTLNQDVTSLVKRLVVDWTLEKEGEKVPCNEENKRRYLPPIAGWRIKNAKYTAPEVNYKSVGSEIIAFSQEIENFTKN
jgi:hypothetical protein